MVCRRRRSSLSVGCRVSVVMASVVTLPTVRQGRPYTPATVRLVEVRLLDGPNVYRLEPAVKLEVALGRRRTWYGQRMPGRHSVVRLGAIVPGRKAPPPLARMVGWVRRPQRVVPESHRGRTTIHRTGEPGMWVIAFPWRERERAELIARSAYRLTDRGSDPKRDDVPRSLER